MRMLNRIVYVVVWTGKLSIVSDADMSIVILDPDKGIIVIYGKRLTVWMRHNVARGMHVLRTWCP